MKTALNDVSELVGKNGKQNLQDLEELKTNPHQPGKIYKLSDALQPNIARWLYIPLEFDDLRVPTPLVMFAVVDSHNLRDFNSSIQVFASQIIKHPNQNDHEFSFVLDDPLNGFNTSKFKIHSMIMKPSGIDQKFQKGEMSIGLFSKHGINDIHFCYTFGCMPKSKEGKTQQNQVPQIQLYQFPKFNQTKMILQNYLNQLLDGGNLMSSQLQSDTNDETDRLQETERNFDIQLYSNNSNLNGALTFQEFLNQMKIQDLQQNIANTNGQQSPVKVKNLVKIKRNIKQEVYRACQMNEQQRYKYLLSIKQTQDQIQRFNKIRNQLSSKRKSELSQQTHQKQVQEQKNDKYLAMNRFQKAIQKSHDIQLNNQKLNVFKVLRRDLLLNFKSLKVEQMIILRKQKYRIRLFIIQVILLKIINKLAYEWMKNKDFFHYQVRIYIASMKIKNRYQKIIEQRGKPFFQRQKFIIQNNIRYYLKYSLNQIFQERAKNIVRQFLYDRNKRVHQYYIKQRKMFTYILNAQKIWRFLFSMYKETVEQYIVQTLQYANNLRTSIQSNKQLQKKFGWLIDEMSQNIQRDKVLTEICENKVQYMKIIRQVNMVRWFALYSIQGNGICDKAAFEYFYKQLDEIIINEKAIYFQESYEKYFKNVNQIEEQILIQQKKDEEKQRLGYNIKVKKTKNQRENIKQIVTQNSQNQLTDESKPLGSQAQVAANSFKKIMKMKKKIKEKEEKAFESGDFLTEDQICSQLELLGIKPFELDSLDPPKFENVPKHQDLKDVLCKVLSFQKNNLNHQDNPIKA